MSLTDGEPLADWPVIDAQEEDIRLLQDALKAKSSEIEGLREQIQESEYRWKEILKEERDGSARLLVTLRRSMRDRIGCLERRLRDMGDPVFRDVPDP